MTGHKWGSDRTERARKGGQFVKSPACDCCGKPTGRDYCTDDEVCGGNDSPGFYLCSRVRCVAKREALDVEGRRALYTAGRALSRRS